MSSSIVERRLAAIIAMDVVGYSRLMGVDEVGTLMALKAHRAELLDPTIKDNGGRVVKTTGDGLLLEFASIVDAIGCAIAIQQGMLARNASVPATEQIVFRIGVNIGDIIIDGDDILGDGVNVAARLEALCEPGGVCISRAANEQIRDKLRLSFADLGEHTVKNIARAIGVFGLAAKDIAALPEPKILGSHRSLPAGPSKSTVLAPAHVAYPWKRRLAFAGLAFVAFAACLGAWWMRREAATTAPSPLASQLLLALQRHSPGSLANARIDEVSAYAASPLHRALAAPRGRSGIWHTANWPSREIAEEKALEKCLQFYDEPCALIAADDGVTPADNGIWPVRDAPRVRYAGVFNPERVPALRQETLLRPEIAEYPTLAGPKAAAFHATGILTLVTAAASQRAAEEKALKDCNADPARNPPGGPCYLYAVQNRVVLPLRLTAPMTPDSTAAPASSSAADVASANPVISPRQSPADVFRAALSAAITDIAPAMSEQGRLATVTGYHADTSHKALAVHPPGNSWRSADWPNESAAEQGVLEACQLRYGDPCVLVAVDDRIQSKPSGGYWQTRPMPRVAYDGPFDPQQIPLLRDAMRQRQDVVDYRKKDGPKAAAVHPWRRIFITTGAASQHDAEVAALADCNSDPTRKGQDGRCWLYAVGDQVVLRKRLQSAMTPAVSAPDAPQSSNSVKPDAVPRKSPTEIFQAALSSLTEDLAPAMPDNRRLEQIMLYHAATSHKALAVHPPADSWRSSDWPNEAAAEQNTLEACQMRYGDPCILVAINEKVQDSSSTGYRRPRSMPRVAYDGLFDPQQIPFVREATRQRQDVVNYRTGSNPKAVAVHPWGRVFIATGASSQRTAQVAALADCNSDPSRDGKDGPCWLYAVDDQVVLPRRLKEPLSAASATR
ncbi:adenylate/guanylate cyclase domain-containing protein [Bradyrhizobium ivorense]|uniref:adenylate/guanylate cyclase domain-containing protein n=1 Tax=Bradyrhizobium ivorense TaxID=2511166 RepID=UPI0010B315CD|nr:adenylate/guanylate cyclase domain-containing protein [Bradyrhizobium ivorense]VIO78115.1 hypothetical protein CI41S_61280 [Bradyrhizobium ivorense]